MLGDMAKKGLFTYAGRTNQAEAKFSSGECAMLTSSSGAQANIKRNAKFEWSVNFIPYHDDVAGAPQNSIIGGASLWVMGGKTNNAYRGVAKFFEYLSRPEVQLDWHKSTGYVPITLAAYEMARKEGYYDKNPGADLAVKQLARGEVTANSKGLRLGRLPEIRNIIQEELEKALQGSQSAQQAMDSAVSRGNKVLRDFEKSVKT